MHDESFFVGGSDALLESRSILVFLCTQVLSFAKKVLVENVKSFMFLLKKVEYLSFIGKVFREAQLTSRKMLNVKV